MPNEERKRKIEYKEESDGDVHVTDEASVTSSDSDTEETDEDRYTASSGN